MCGRNGKKRGNCIGYQVAFTKRTLQYIQMATIQSILGTKARRVLKTLPNIPGDITQRTVGGILTALETYCVPRKNTTYERYVFRMTIQEDRSFDIFVTDLRRRAEYCDFGAIKDSLIRDQIVVGINDPKLRERLLRETDLTLEKAQAPQAENTWCMRQFVNIENCMGKSPIVKKLCK